LRDAATSENESGQDNARALDNACRVAVCNEQERVARALHDSVINRLFEIGLSLQGTLMLLVDQPSRDRVEHAIEDLDATIREIRSTVFALEAGSMGTQRSVGPAASRT